MPSLKERIRMLEDDLTAPELRISAYHDMPFAILQYEPEDELDARSEVALLATRLRRQHGKNVIEISLADLMFRALDSEVGLDSLFEGEVSDGLERTIDTVHNVLTDLQPLDTLIAEQLKDHDPKRAVAFLTRAEALYPAFRTSAVLENMRGKIHVPTVLLYPGVLQGTVGLSFMGVCEADHNYRPKIY
ncbi:MAG: DUF1788 domain-containing protein [Acidobacteriia bacterium]|nr:DUF1788 domain-containing protein [Terriglobia bacterium]